MYAATSLPRVERLLIHILIESAIILLTDFYEWIEEIEEKESERETEKRE